MIQTFIFFLMTAARISLQTTQNDFNNIKHQNIYFWPQLLKLVEHQGAPRFAVKEGDSAMEDTMDGLDGIEATGQPNSGTTVVQVGFSLSLSKNYRSVLRRICY